MDGPVDAGAETNVLAVLVVLVALINEVGEVEVSLP